MLVSTSAGCRAWGAWLDVEGRARVTVDLEAVFPLARAHIEAE